MNEGVEMKSIEELMQAKNWVPWYHKRNLEKWYDILQAVIDDEVKTKEVMKILERSFPLKH